MRTATAFALGLALALAEPAQSQGLTVYRHGSTYSDIPGTGAPVVIHENTIAVVQPVNTPLTYPAPGIRINLALPAPPGPVIAPVIVQVTIRQAPTQVYLPPAPFYPHHRHH